MERMLRMILRRFVMRAVSKGVDEIGRRSGADPEMVKSGKRAARTMRRAGRITGRF